MSDKTEFEIFDRWISIIRLKAKYDHEARKKGVVVTSPDLDDICNEMEAYQTGRMSSRADFNFFSGNSPKDDFPIDPNPATVDFGDN